MNSTHMKKLFFISISIALSVINLLGMQKSQSAYTKLTDCKCNFAAQPSAISWCFKIHNNTNESREVITHTSYKTFSDFDENSTHYPLGPNETQDIKLQNSYGRKLSSFSLLVPHANSHASKQSVIASLCKSSEVKETFTIEDNHIKVTYELPTTSPNGILFNDTMTIEVATLLIAADVKTKESHVFQETAGT